jgi:hypothetical protein
MFFMALFCGIISGFLPSYFKAVIGAMIGSLWCGLYMLSVIVSHEEKKHLKASGVYYRMVRWRLGWTVLTAATACTITYLFKLLLT